MLKETMTENPLVSIIVRTKDRPVLLERALKSIAAQIYRPIEVVLVNDGGCDLVMEKTENILGNISLTYVRLEENTGRAHAGNVGIENAHGDYIGFLDDDDEYYPDHVLVLTGTLRGSQLKIAYTDADTIFIEIDKEGEIFEKSKQVKYSHIFSPQIMLIQNYIPFMCLLFSRDVFAQVRFDERFEIFEDWMLLIALSQTYWFEHIHRITARYNQWSDESQINRRALLEDFSREAYQRVLSENKEKISTETIYAYCVHNADERQRFHDELIKKESEYFKEKLDLTDELRHLRSEKLRLNYIKARLEVEKKRLESEQRKLRAEMQQIAFDKNALFDELMGLRNYVMDLSNSMGWNLIERYRTIKEKVAPLGTRRRFFYELFLKSVKVIKNEGLKGFLCRVRRKSHMSFNAIKFKLKLKRLRSIHFAEGSPMAVQYDFIQAPVHIIIPVFNGYECIRDCMESILRNTDLSRHTVMIIDDKSTDARIHDYLKKIDGEKDKKKIHIVYNESNLGFTKTVNSGMESTKEDVILLNSDTIVTKDWISKLQRAAYSKLRVATATPLSNYVTINGIPEPFHYNPIPNGMDIDAFAEFLEKSSLRYYPEIPAGVGFCMYIKRSVLNDLGYFDEKSFGRGYAEETDFCMRALKKGYTHVLDDSTYIYHIGGVSFESVKDPEVLREKNLMIEKNLETLKALHPEYAGLVAKALSENLAPIHTYINFRIRRMEDAVECPVCDRSEA